MGSPHVQRQIHTIPSGQRRLDRLRRAYWYLPAVPAMPTGALLFLLCLLLPARGNCGGMSTRDALALGAQVT